MQPSITTLQPAACSVISLYGTSALKSSASLLIKNLTNYNASKNDISLSNVLCVLENLLGQCAHPLLRTLHAARRNESTFSSYTEKARTRLIHYTEVVIENAIDLVQSAKSASKGAKFDQRNVLLICYDILEKLHELYPCKIHLTSQENWHVENVEHALIYVTCAIDILQRYSKKSLQKNFKTSTREAGRIHRAMDTLANVVSALEKSTYGRRSRICFRNTQVAVYTSRIASAATPANATIAVASHLSFRASTLMQMITKIKHSPTYNGLNKHYIEIAFEAHVMLMDSIKRFTTHNNSSRLYIPNQTTTRRGRQHGNILLTKHNLFEGLCFADSLLPLLEKSLTAFPMPTTREQIESAKSDIHEICRLFKNALPLCYNNALHGTVSIQFSFKHSKNLKTIDQITTAMNSVLNIVKRAQFITLFDSSEEVHLALQGITLSAERIISRFDSKDDFSQNAQDNSLTDILTTYPGEVAETKMQLAQQRGILKKCERRFRNCAGHFTEVPNKIYNIISIIVFHMKNNSTKYDNKLSTEAADPSSGLGSELPNASTGKQPLPSHPSCKPSSALMYPKVEHQQTVLVQEENCRISET